MTSGRETRWRHAALAACLCALVCAAHCVAAQELEAPTARSLISFSSLQSAENREARDDTSTLTPTPARSSSTNTTSANAASATDEAALYKRLAEATLDGKSWSGSILQPFSVSSLAKLLAKVVLYLTKDPAKTTLLEKYTSLGRELPSKLDLTGLRASHATISTDEWTQVLTATTATLEDSSGSGSDAALLWSCATSLFGIQALEKNAAKLADLDKEPQLRQQYFASVRGYFQASVSLALGNKTLSTVEQINATEVVGRFALDSDEWWRSDLVADEDSNVKATAAAVLTELSLLKHIPVTMINSGSGSELLGSIASKYLDSAGDAAENSNFGKLQKLFGDDALEAYASVAQAFCTPDHDALRFCLLTQLADQGHEFASTLSSLVEPSSGVTKLSLEATNLNRQAYLETVQKRINAQTLSLEIVQAFNTLSLAVQEASTSTIARAQNASLERVKSQQRAVELQLGQQASSLLNAASTEKAGSEEQLSAQLQSISSSTTDVDKLFEAYADRLRVIANAAYGAAAAKTVRGFFGLFKKILRALNPVTWITNPGALVDVFSSANDFRKDVSGVNGVKKLTRLLQDGLVPQMNQLTDQLINLYPKLLQIRDALNLIVPTAGDNATSLVITSDSLNAHSSNFLKVYGEYDNPVLRTDVDVLETLFVNLQSAFCQVGGGRAPTECAQVTTDVQMFAKLRESVVSSMGAMDSLVATARAAVAEQSAKILSALLQQVSNETSAALVALQDKWDTENAQNTREFELYRRRLKYGEAVSSLTLLSSSIDSAEASVTACSFFSYLNGGVPITPCESLYASSGSGSSSASGSKLDVKELIAFKLNNKPDAVQRIAYIPTAPSSTGDLHYLSLERLLKSATANVTFRLPQNQQWLRKYNWVPADFDLNSTVVFVTKFQLLLPSKQLSSSKAGSGSNKRTVSIMAQAGETSDLGPAVDNKVYEIPTRSYSFRYQESTSGTCELKLSNPYLSCDARLPSSFCVLSTGDVDADDETPLPSLFSTFSIQTSLSLAAASSVIKTLSFAGVEASAPLAVAIDLQLYQVKSKKSSTAVGAIEESSDAGSGDGSASDGSAAPSSRRLRREASGSASQESATSARCCAVDSYLTDWTSGSCAECPEGHVSQLGGLYCVPKPSSSSSSSS